MTHSIPTEASQDASEKPTPQEQAGGKQVDKPCPFCEKIAQMKLHWSVGIVEFEPLNPVTPGHRLFVPVRHVKDFGTSPIISGWVMEAASKYARNKLSTDYNIITSKGTDATQSVFHLHVHVVPRTPNDGLSLPWTGQERVTDMKSSDPEANTEVPLSRPEAHQDDAVLAARLEELDYIRMQPKDSIWGMIAERKASLLRQKESQS